MSRGEHDQSAVGTPPADGAERARTVGGQARAVGGQARAVDGQARAVDDGRSSTPSGAAGAGIDGGARRAVFDKPSGGGGVSEGADRPVRSGSSPLVKRPQTPAGPAGQGRPASSPSDSSDTVVLDRTAGQRDDPAARTYPWHLAGTGPIPTLDGPVRRRWRKVAARTASKAWGDSLFGLSSQAAFWCALSTAPLLLALLGLVGFVAPLFGPDTIGQIQYQINIFLHTLFNPEVANNLVGETVRTILDHGRSDVVSVGLLISLWAGSSAMSAFVESITVAYCQHEVRHPAAERFFALLLYLIALVAGILMLPLLAIGPTYLPHLFGRFEATVTTIVNIAYYPFLVIGLLLLLTTLYKVAPKHRHAWKRGLPGAMLAAIVFLVASIGLRLYLAYVYSHGLTYGALATPITFLLFYYFVSMAIIIGAQFNNALLEYYPPRRSRREQRKWRQYDPARHGAAIEAAQDGYPAGPPAVADRSLAADRSPSADRSLSADRSVSAERPLAAD